MKTNGRKYCLLLIAAVITSSVSAPAGSGHSPSESDYFSPQNHGQRFRVILDAPINSRSAKEEEEFAGRTESEFRMNNHLVRAGSIVRGRVATRPPVKPGSLALIFDSLQSGSATIKLNNANVVTNANTAAVERGPTEVLLRSKVIPSIFSPGGTICTGIGAIARREDGRDQMYGPRRTFVVLSGRLGKPVDLKVGDRLEIQVDYFSPLKKWTRSR